MISLNNICKKYGEKVIFDSLSLDIESEKITVILGESGSGKTTLLNVITGQTSYLGSVTGVERPVSLVAQRDCLVKNLTVFENLKLVTKKADFTEGLKKVGLLGRENDYVKNLSGGEARRVAILRATGFSHSTLVMDEPFSSLDLRTKYAIINDIKENQRSKKSTVICVTHDIDEAISLADNIVVIKEGKIIFNQKNIGGDMYERLKSVIVSSLLP